MRDAPARSVHSAAPLGRCPFASSHSTNTFSSSEATVRLSAAAARSAASFTAGSTLIPIAAVRALFASLCICLQIADYYCCQHRLVVYRRPQTIAIGNTMPSRYTYQTRNPRAAHNPIASIPLLRPAHEVIGWTEAQKATFCLARDRNNLAAAEERYASACAALGRANKHRFARRRLRLRPCAPSTPPVVCCVSAARRWLHPWPPHPLRWRPDPFRARRNRATWAKRGRRQEAPSAPCP